MREAAGISEEAAGRGSRGLSSARAQGLVLSSFVVDATGEGLAAHVDTCAPALKRMSLHWTSGVQELFMLRGESVG
jgi:hypothetical protein